MVDSKGILKGSVIEINQNFSKVARLVDVLEISKRLLAQNKEAYEVLAE